MELKNLISTNKVIKVNHPYLEGFVLDVAYVSREKTRKMIERATTMEFNKKTHKPEESLDNDLFLKLQVKELIKGWKGLKLNYLPELIPVDFSSTEYTDTEELDYSEQNALDLMKNSTELDNWLSTIVSDIKNFNKSN